MKKILMAAVALTALAATPAMAAPSTSQSYSFDGTVAAICTISGAASTVNFGALTDASGNYTQGGMSKVATDTNAYCNQGLTTATLTHTNLVNTNISGAGYTSVLPMNASLATTEGSNFADTTPAAGNGVSAGTTATIGTFTGLTVTATLASGPYRLTSGTYTGSITVTLTPTS